MRHRLAVVATHPIQYLAPWYRHLAQQPELDVTVLYGSGHGLVAGGYEPEFGRSVRVDPHPSLAGRFMLTLGKQQHILTPQPTSTGVIRLENAKAGLVWLQVLRHDDLAEQAESNRTAVVPIVPNRGQILDRHGVVLATNYSAYTLEITPSRVADLEQTIEALSKVVDIQPRDRRRFKKLQEESKSFESLPIRTRLTDEEVARFAAHRFQFPGVEIKARLFRTYPFGELASHVIGYMGAITKETKDQYVAAGYNLNERASKSAIFEGWKEMDQYMRENKIEGVRASEAKPEPVEEILPDQKGKPGSKASGETKDKAATAKTKAGEKPADQTADKPAKKAAE